MTEKYKPNGIPLTPYEREVLTILQEECAEVIQAASKLLRFGKENRPDAHTSNQVVLSHEVGDMLEMVSMAEDQCLIYAGNVAHGRKRKRERLARYMQNESPAKD